MLLLFLPNRPICLLLRTPIIPRQKPRLTKGGAFSLILTFELTRLALVHAHVTIIALAQRRCFERGAEKIMRYPSIYDIRFMALWGRLLDSFMTRRSVGVQINLDFYLEILSYSMRIESWSHAFSFYDFSLFGCFVKGSRRCHYTILVSRLLFFYGYMAL